MENASKALLIAGGVLIGILVLGALVLMVNQLGNYQRQNFSSEAEKQVAQFNQEFTRFADQDIKGVDIITLVNKVIDYNKRSGGVNALNYDIKITLKIENINGFTSKYAPGGSKLFTRNDYTISNNSFNNELTKAITEYIDYEHKYGLEVLKRLSSNYDEIYVNKTKDTETVIGKKIPELEEDKGGGKIIEGHREYSEFKTAKFRCDIDKITYTEGQISGLTFSFLK